MSRNPHNLLVVPGHASFKETVNLPLPENFADDTHWALQPFQKGEPPYYVEHIQAGLSNADEETFVVFSGGRTRPESGPQWSEAKTYHEIAKLYPEYDKLAHVALEEYARDSFQNLEFSINAFRSAQGQPPRHIAVVGWEFKRQRFQFHAETLGIPSGDFTYLGVNNPAPEDIEGALRGEAKALEDFHRVPRGDSGILLEKRLSRDPFGDSAG